MVDMEDGIIIAAMTRKIKVPMFNLILLLISNLNSLKIQAFKMLDCKF